MITDEQFNDWAQSPTRNPVLLVEITHKDGVVYLSDSFYATEASDTPAHISYDVCLKENVIVERTLDANSLGAVRVYNDGSLDHWLNNLWTDYAIEVFVGDKSWARDSFRRQYKSTVESFTQLSATVFEFKSTLVTDIIQTDIYNVNNLFIGGSQIYSLAKFIGFNGNTGAEKLYIIAPDSKIDRASVRVFYDGYEMGVGIYNLPTWVDSGDGHS